MVMLEVFTNGDVPFASESDDTRVAALVCWNREKLDTKLHNQT